MAAYCWLLPVAASTLTFCGSPLSTDPLRGWRSSTSFSSPSQLQVQKTQHNTDRVVHCSVPEHTAQYRSSYELFYTGTHSTHSTQTPPSLRRPQGPHSSAWRMPVRLQRDTTLRSCSLSSPVGKGWAVRAYPHIWASFPCPHAGPEPWHTPITVPAGLAPWLPGVLASTLWTTYWCLYAAVHVSMGCFLHAMGSGHMDTTEFASKLCAVVWCAFLGGGQG